MTGLRFLKISSIIIIQFFLTTSVNLTDAFAYNKEQVVKEQGQNLAANTKPFIESVTPQTIEHVSKEITPPLKPSQIAVLGETEEATIKEIKREIKDICMDKHPTEFIDQLIANAEAILKLKNKYKSNDINLADILFAIASIYYRSLGKKQGPELVSDIIKSAEFGTIIALEIKQHEYEESQKGSETSYKGILFKEVQDTAVNFLKYRYLDISSSKSDWDENGFDHYIDLAERLIGLDKMVVKNVVMDGQSKNEEIKIEEIIRQLASIDLKDTLPTDLAVLKKQILAVFKVLRASHSGEKEKKIFKLLSELEVDVAVADKRKILQSKTLKTVCTDKGVEAGLLAGAPDLEGVNVEVFILAKKLVKFFAIQSVLNYEFMKEVEDKSSIAGKSKQVIKILMVLSIGVGVLLLVLHFILGALGIPFIPIVAPAFGIVFPFVVYLIIIPVSVYFLGMALYKFYQVIVSKPFKSDQPKDSKTYFERGLKNDFSVLKIGLPLVLMAGVGLALYFAAGLSLPVILTISCVGLGVLWMFLNTNKNFGMIISALALCGGAVGLVFIVLEGLLPFVWAGLIFAGVAFVIAFILNLKYVDDTRLPQRNLIGFMKSKMSELFKGPGAANTIEVERTSATGQYLMDIHNCIKIFKEISTEFEARRSAILGEVPTKLGLQTVSQIYLSVKAATFNVSYFSSDRNKLATSDENMTKWKDMAKKEVEACMKQLEKQSTQVDDKMYLMTKRKLLLNTNEEHIKRILRLIDGESGLDVGWSTSYKLAFRELDARKEETKKLMRGTYVFNEQEFDKKWAEAEKEVFEHAGERSDSERLKLEKLENLYKKYFRFFAGQFAEADDFKERVFEGEHRVFLKSGRVVPDKKDREKFDTFNDKATKIKEIIKSYLEEKTPYVISDFIVKYQNFERFEKSFNEKVAAEEKKINKEQEKNIAQDFDINAIYEYLVALCQQKNKRENLTNKSKVYYNQVMVIKQIFLAIRNIDRTIRRFAKDNLGNDALISITDDFLSFISGKDVASIIEHNDRIKLLENGDYEIKVNLKELGQDGLFPIIVSFKDKAGTDLFKDFIAKRKALSADKTLKNNKDYREVKDKLVKIIVLKLKESEKEFKNYKWAMELLIDEESKGMTKLWEWFNKNKKKGETINLTIAEIEEKLKVYPKKIEAEVDATAHKTFISERRDLERILGLKKIFKDFGIAEDSIDWERSIQGEHENKNSFVERNKTSLDKVIPAIKEKLKKMYSERKALSLVCYLISNNFEKKALAAELPDELLIYAKTCWRTSLIDKVVASNFDNKKADVTKEWVGSELQLQKREKYRENSVMLKDEESAAKTIDSLIVRQKIDKKLKSMSEFWQEEKGKSEEQRDIYGNELYGYKFGQEVDILFELDKGWISRITSGDYFNKALRIFLGLCAGAVVAGLGVIAINFLYKVAFDVITILVVSLNPVIAFSVGGAIIGLGLLIMLLKVLFKKQFSPVSVFFIVVGVLVITMPFYVPLLGSLFVISAMPTWFGLLALFGGALLVCLGMSILKKGHGWIGSAFIGLGIVVNIILIPIIFSNPIFFTLGLVSIISLVLVKVGLDKWINDRSHLVGPALLVGGILLTFLTAFTIGTILGVTGGTALILFLSFELPVYGFAVLCLLWNFIKPAGFINTDDSSIESYIKKLKQTLEKGHYDLNSESINPLTIFMSKFKKGQMQDDLVILKRRLIMNAGTSDPEKIADKWDKIYQAKISSAKSEKEKADFMAEKAVVKMAFLLDEYNNFEKLIDRIKDVERRVVSPELTGTINFEGKVDLLKKSGANLTLGSRFKRFIEGNKINFYFTAIFTVAFLMTALMVTPVILVLAITTWSILIKVIFIVVLACVFFYLNINSGMSLADRSLTKILQPPLNPEVEQPLGHIEKNFMMYTMSENSPDQVRKIQDPSKNLAKMMTAYEMFNRKQYGQIALSVIDKKFDDFGASLENNPGSKQISHVTTPFKQPDMIQHYYRLMLQLANQYGWERVMMLHKESPSWGSKWGQIQDANRWLMGRSIATTAYNTKGRTEDEYEEAMPLYIDATLGGGELDLSTKIGREKASEIQDLRRVSNYASPSEFLNWYTGRASLDQDRYDLNEEDFGMFLSPNDFMEELKTKNGNVGHVNMLTLDGDNVVLRNTYNEIFNTYSCRYNSRFIGIQQPRTTSDNAYDTQLSEFLSWAHDKLFFYQQSLFMMLERFSYYGKGSMSIPMYQLNVADPEMIETDTLSHDTVEANANAEVARLHKSTFSALNYDKYIGEGQAQNFQGQTIKNFSRWYYGTMQSVRELSSPGSAVQKWITSIPIRGYLGEMVFFVYLMLMFFAVPFSLLILAPTVVSPTILTLFLFLASMFMILFFAKFTDLWLWKGGYTKNFMDAIEETFLSTTIFLNNVWPGTMANVKELNNRIQINATGTANPPIWIPSAVSDGVVKYNSLRNNFHYFKPQFTLGLLMLACLVFIVMFVPALGLVWSNLWVYLAWSSLLYWSWIIGGWYFGYKVGQNRENLVAAMEKVENGEKGKGRDAAVFSTRIGNILEEIWGRKKVGRMWNAMGTGIKDKLGDDFKALRDYFRCKKENPAEADSKAREICNNAVSKISSKITKFAVFVGAALCLVGVIGLLNAVGLFFVSGIAAASSLFLPYGVLLAIGIAFILLVVLGMKASNSPSVQTARQLLMVVFGIGIILLGVFAFGVEVPVIVVGAVMIILGFASMYFTHKDKVRYDYFNPENKSKGLTPEVYRDYLRNYLWDEQNGLLAQQEKEALIKAFGGKEDVAKEEYFQYFYNIFAEEENIEREVYFHPKNEEGEYNYKKELDLIRERGILPVEFLSLLKQEFTKKDEHGVKKFCTFKELLPENPNPDYLKMLRATFLEPLKSYLILRDEFKNKDKDKEELYYALTRGDYEYVKHNMLMESLVDATKLKQDEKPVKMIEALEQFFAKLYGVTNARFDGLENTTQKYASECIGKSIETQATVNKELMQYYYSDCLEMYKEWKLTGIGEGKKGKKKIRKKDFNSEIYFFSPVLLDPLWELLTKDSRYINKDGEIVCDLDTIIKQLDEDITTTKNKELLVRKDGILKVLSHSLTLEKYRKLYYIVNSWGDLVERKELTEEQKKGLTEEQIIEEEQKLKNDFFKKTEKTIEESLDRFFGDLYGSEWRAKPIPAGKPEYMDGFLENYMFNLQIFKNFFLDTKRGGKIGELIRAESGDQTEDFPKIVDSLNRFLGKKENVDAVEKFTLEEYKDAVNQYNFISRKKQEQEAWTGTLGLLFYHQFGDAAYKEKVGLFMDAVFNDPSLANIKKIDKQNVYLFLDKLKVLNSFPWNEGDIIKNRLLELTHNSPEELADILDKCDYFKAITIANRLKIKIAEAVSNIPNIEEESKKKPEERKKIKEKVFFNIYMKQGILSSSDREVLKRYPALICRLFAIRMNRNDLDDIINVLSQMEVVPMQEMETMPNIRSLFFHYTNKEDLNEEIIRDMLSVALNNLGKDGRKDYKSFFKLFNQILLPIHGTEEYKDFKLKVRLKDKGNLTEKEIQEQELLLTKKFIEQDRYKQDLLLSKFYDKIFGDINPYYVDQVEGSDISFVKEWKWPRNWNLLTFWNIFKKVLPVIISLGLGMVLGWVMFTILGASIAVFPVACILVFVVSVGVFEIIFFKGKNGLVDYEYKARNISIVLSLAVVSLIGLFSLLVTTMVGYMVLLGVMIAVYYVIKNVAEFYLQLHYEKDFYLSMKALGISEQNKEHTGNSSVAVEPEEPLSEILKMIYGRKPVKPYEDSSRIPRDGVDDRKEDKDFRTPIPQTSFERIIADPTHSSVVFDVDGTLLNLIENMEEYPEFVESIAILLEHGVNVAICTNNEYIKQKERILDFIDNLLDRRGSKKYKKFFTMYANGGTRRIDHDGNGNPIVGIRKTGKDKNNLLACVKEKFIVEKIKKKYEKDFKEVESISDEKQKKEKKEEIQKKLKQEIEEEFNQRKSELEKLCDDIWNALLGKCVILKDERGENVIDKETGEIKKSAAIMFDIDIDRDTKDKEVMEKNKNSPFRVLTTEFSKMINEYTKLMKDMKSAEAAKEALNKEKEKKEKTEEEIADKEKKIEKEIKKIEDGKKKILDSLEFLDELKDKKEAIMNMLCATNDKGENDLINYNNTKYNYESYSFDADDLEIVKQSLREIGDDLFYLDDKSIAAVKTFIIEDKNCRLPWLDKDNPGTYDPQVYGPSTSIKQNVDAPYIEARGSLPQGKLIRLKRDDAGKVTTEEDLAGKIPQLNISLMPPKDLKGASIPMYNRSRVALLNKFLAKIKIRKGEKGHYPKTGYKFSLGAFASMDIGTSMKEDAVNNFIKAKKLIPKQTIYFGNEFATQGGEIGNDHPVLGCSGVWCINLGEHEADLKGFPNLRDLPWKDKVGHRGTHEFIRRIAEEFKDKPKLVEGAPAKAKAEPAAPQSSPLYLAQMSLDNLAVDGNRIVKDAEAPAELGAVLQVYGKVQTAINGSVVRGELIDRLKAALSRVRMHVAENVSGFADVVTETSGEISIFINLKMISEIEKAYGSLVLQNFMMHQVIHEIAASVMAVKVEQDCHLTYAGLRQTLVEAKRVKEKGLVDAYIGQRTAVEVEEVKNELELLLLLQPDLERSFGMPAGKLFDVLKDTHTSVKPMLLSDPYESIFGQLAESVKQKDPADIILETNAKAILQTLKESVNAEVHTAIAA